MSDSTTIFDKEKDKEKVKEENRTPSRPLTSRDRAYLLQFRHKNRFGTGNGRVKEKVFWFDGNLKEAVARVRIHCEKMDYTYIYCFPFIVDLEAQEKLKASDTDAQYEDEY